MAPRVILITGTSSGLGLDLAKLLLSDSEVYKVIGISRGPLDKDHELSKCPKYTHKVMDQRSCESVEQVFAEVGKEEGRLDVLVNNAAFGAFGTTEQTDLKHWHDMFETNVFGVIRCTHGALKLMRQARAGQIINISSVAGFQGVPFNDSYVSTKFAMEGFSESQASYLHRYGIHVSLVEPGPLATEFPKTVDTQNKLSDPEDAYSALAPEFEKMMSSQYSDDNVVQSASEAAETTKKAIDDWPNVQFRYQTSDVVKATASDRWKYPTGYSLIEKYGRSVFSSQDPLPKDQSAK
ncbi:hypothetical protein WJX74_002437 [Apatococcus lobatus]|uniref:Uncharacterized protein n=1 Tax=Apatococcus lobatus TaxID=904363 RepID=A0AAW1S3N3_9CHLO